MSLNLLIDFKLFEMKIQGQAVTMELRPLTREYMILLNELFDEIIEASSKVVEKKDAKSKSSKIDVNGKKVSIDDIKQGVKMFNSNLKHQKYADPIFKNHVRNIKGITVNNKEPTPEQFANEPSLCNMTVEILTELVTRSNLKFDEVKN